MTLRQAISAAALAGGLCFAQQGPTPQPDQVASETASVEGVYGKIKHVKDGDKIVIDVDKGRDRTYSLAKDPKRLVTVADGLAIGDKVKVMETAKGDIKSVQIVRDVRNAGETGQRARTADERK